MAIIRTAITDDSGGGTDGTGLDNAWKQELYNQMDAAYADRPGVSTPTTTGTQTALAIPAGTGNLVINAYNSSLLTIQGIAAGLPGQQLTIVAMNAQIDLKHLHASGTALGKLALFATTGTTSLAGGNSGGRGGIAVLQYTNELQWELIAHEQGPWITPAFAAGNFTGFGLMTWTVDAGDVSACAYLLRGRQVTLRFYLITTSVGGTPNVVLQIGNGAWGGFSALANALQLYVKSDNGGASIVSESGATGTVIQFFNGSSVGATNWTAATNTTAIRGTITFEVL